MALRLFGVYLLTAAVVGYFASRRVRKLPLLSWLVISAAPLILLGRAFVTAGVYAPLDIHYHGEPLASYRADMQVARTQTPILGDVVYQEIPWRKAVREAVKNGRLPLWNRFVLAGEPLLAVQQPAVLHPATWIGFLLPLAQAWTFEMAFRHFLAILCAYLFLRELRCRELPALFGALAWGFSDYLIFWAGYPLTAAAAPFPLLLLGLRRLATDQDRRSVALTVTALLLILTAGHPETLLHCVAGAGIYFLFTLWPLGARSLRKALLLSLVAGALALGLGAVLILPLMEALPWSWEYISRTAWYAHVTKSLGFPESLLRLTQNFVPYAFGISGRGATVPDINPASGYAGSLVFPLALVGLTWRGREKWALALIGLLGFAVGVRMFPFIDALAALPLFDIALNERLVFFTAFALSVLAALGLDRLLAGFSPIAVAIAALSTAVVLFLLHDDFRGLLAVLQMPREYLRLRTVLLIAPPLVLGVICLVLSRRHVTAIAAGALGLFAVQRGLEADVYPTIHSAAFYPRLEILDPIPRGAPYRVAGVGYTFIPNVAAMYELEDVRGYEAMTFAPLFETYPLWSVHQPVWFNRIDDPQKPFLSFLNVRYFIAPPGYGPPKGWKVLAEGKGGLVVENPTVLPRAFVPKLLAVRPDPAGQMELLKSISDFAVHGVVSTGPGDSSWRANGRARVEIATYLPQRLVLDVQAEEEAVVATSVTRWPGWKIHLDGKRLEPLVYNHAFIGLRVPAGRHRVALNYLPDGFLWGLAASSVTALLGVALHLRRGRRAEAR